MSKLEEAAKIADMHAASCAETALQFEYTSVHAQKYRARANEAELIAQSIRALSASRGGEGG